MRVNIGHVVQSMEFSDLEKDRLETALLDPSSRQCAVFRSGALGIRDPDFWSRAFKRFGIKGFRPGQPLGKEQVLRRALESLSVESGAKNQKVWPLYRRCVIEHVIHDLSELNTLLLSEDFEEGEGTQTEQILKSIARALPLYGDIEEQVRELYLLWGFDRTDRFEEILRHSEFDIDVVRRMIARECAEVRTDLGDRIAESRLRIESQVQRGLANAAADTEAHLSRLDKTLTEALAAANGEIERAFELLRQIQLSPGRPQPPVEARQESLNRGDIPAVNLATFQALRTKVDGLAGMLGRHEKILVEELQSRGGRRRSVTQKQTGEVTEKLKDALVRCREVVADSGFPAMLLVQVWALMEIMRRARLIVSPRGELLLAAVRSIPNVESKRIGASPLWTNRSEWKDALDFVSDATQGPRVLEIHDFDVALQEAYLVPALREWLGSGAVGFSNRIFLFASTDGMENVSRRVLECGIVMPRDAVLVELLQRLGSEIDAKHLDYWSEAQSVDPLVYMESPNRQFEEQIRLLASNSGADVPRDVAAQFVNVASGLARRVGEQHGAQLASEVTLLQWLRLCRGDGAARIFEETLRTVYGAQ